MNKDTGFSDQEQARRRVEIPDGASLTDNPVAHPSVREIFRELEEQVLETDLEGELGENFKQKHLIVYVVEKVLEIAKANNWNLARQGDFVYLYTSRHWQVIDKDVVKRFLSHCAIRLGYSRRESRYFEFQDKMLKQFLTEGYLPPPQPDLTKVLVNLENGTFEVTEDGYRIREHRAEDFLTHLLPFGYEEGRGAPLFEAYLDRVLPDDSAQAVLAEFLGYVFTRQMKLEKALMLYGGGANGKSVFFDIMNALLGRENVTTCSLSHLSEEHNRAMIANKLLNYGSEISGAGNNRDTFKALVSGEPIQARLKYGNSFIMEHYAKLAFNANELPKDVEHNEAYFRRFLIIPFGVTIPEEERIPDLARQIISGELPGVFNWVLRGLNRLLKNGKFSRCRLAEEALAAYKKESDSVALFVDEPESHYIPSKDPDKWKNLSGMSSLYEEYRTFCMNAGFRSVSVRTFSERLHKLGFEVKRRNSGRIVFCEKVEIDGAE